MMQAEFTIFAHQARYEEGHLAADAPLDREKLTAAMAVLANVVSHEIEWLATKKSP
ncbi:MAG: hypothetical protein K9K38_12960 [Rhodoferax sp.]|nr:hypothetical protein [Rhodoferax sp.]